MEEISFIHVADLHLDSPLKGLEHTLPTDIVERMKESSFISLRRIVNKAIQEKVDFVLIAGDIYDSEHRSIRAQIKFQKEMERLQKEQIKVFLIHGNHDFLVANGNQLDLPANVHVFGEEVAYQIYERDGKVLACIYGFSYGQRAVTENMTIYYEKKTVAPYHIGMLHGSVEQSTEHDTYAPFQIKQLQEKDFDYWALGHIHKRQILSTEPPIVYAGNIQGRHKKETGEKGCYVVRLSEQGSQYEFFSTNDITWKHVELLIRGDASEDQKTAHWDPPAKTGNSHYHLTCDTASSFLKECLDVLEKERERDRGVFLTLTLRGERKSLSFLRESGAAEEFFMTMLENEENREDFVWIVSYEDETYESIHVKEDSFLGEVLTLAAAYKDMDQLLGTFTDTAFSRKIGLDFSKEEKEGIQREAKLLLYHLFQEEGE